MRHLFVLMCLLISFTGHANCRFEMTPQDVKVKWLPYKTPKKVAVQGEFKKFSFNSTKAEDVFGSLNEATFNWV